MPNMKTSHTLAVSISCLVLLLSSRGNAVAQLLFFDNFEQFGNGTDLTTTNYAPASGPLSASAVTTVQNGSATIKATNFFGSTWALFNNSVVTNKNSYKGTLSKVQTNQTLRLTWKMWIQATNSGPGMFLLSVPVKDTNPSVTYNPPLAFKDTGSIIALTNGTNVLIPIGNWGSLAGTVMTNTLMLDYPHDTFSYSLNGQRLATLPLGPYFTNVVGAFDFTGFERSAGSLGNRFAIDDVKVEAVSAPPFQWAKRVANTMDTDFEPGHGLAIDSTANIYMTGWFDGTNDFGNGIMLTNTPGGGQDIFVVKYNSAGQAQWARQAGGNSTERDSARGIGVDSAGHVYVAGGIFDAFQHEEFFLARYDNAGALEWVQPSDAGTSGYDLYGTGLAVDSAGNSFALVFLDQSSGQGLPVTFGSRPVAVPIGYGLCTVLVKYDSTGAAQWAQLLGSSNQCYSTAVAVDDSGNVYVAGEFQTSLTIGETNPTNFISRGGKDGFVAKFNGAGNFLWGRQMSGSSDSGVEAVSADAYGNVYLAGGFGSAKGDTNFFGSSITLTNIGGGLSGTGIGDAFLAKYDAATGTPIWALRAGGTNLDAYTGVSTDSQGNIYVGGAIGGAAGSGGFTAFKAVIAKCDPNGLVQWTQSSTGTNALVFGGPLVTASGICYVAGWFQTKAVFGTNTLTGRGDWDFFVAQLGSTPLTLGIQWTNSSPLLSVSGEIGNRFALERVSALPGSNNWRPLLTNTLTTSPVFHTDTNAGGSSTRVYRARLVP